MNMPPRESDFLIDLEHSNPAALRHEQNSEALQSEFGTRLRTLREMHNLSVKALASLAGVSTVAIWHWETGARKPQRRHFYGLAKALNVPLSSFGPICEPLTVAQSENLMHLAQSADLMELIATAKRVIAQAAGREPDDVAITIQY